jgi:peptide/nickel transport system substrate-binding protein
MQENRFGHRLRRREVLKLIAAGTSVSALMAASSAQALAATTSNVARAAFAAGPAFAQGATNQLNIAWNAAPPNLNPLNAVSQAQWTTFASIYSTLCMSDPQNQTFAPDLAESWDIAPDGSSYVFHLRNNAKWHDGQPVTAADVEYTYTMALHPDTTSNLAGQFSAIKGAADFTAGKTTQVPGITVLDDHTIRFDMEVPSGIFMIQTVQGPTPFAILPKHLLGSVKPADLAKSPQLTTSPVGSGPFKFVRYVPDQFIELQANPDYHFGKPAIDKLVFNIVQSPDATSVAMDRGEIDMPLFDTGTAPADMYRKYVTDPKFKIVGVGDGPVIGYGFNFRKDGIRDPRLHQAWLYALDRQTLNSTFNLGAGKIVNSWMIHQWYQRPEWADMYQFNPDQARALLSEMGWDSSRVVNVNVITLADDNTRSWIAAEQQMLGDVGIQIAINEMDVATWVNQFYNEPHDFEAVRVTFGAFPDPAGFLSFHMQSASKNAFGYANPTLDQKIKAGEQQIDPSQRVPIYQDIAQQMLNDLPVAPVVWQNTWLIQNRRFHIPQFEALTPATSLSDVPLATRFLTGADYFKFRQDQWTLG